MSQTLLPSPSLVTPISRTLTDRYGRIAHSLRISLTDRCNLRCTYCMPPEGLEWLPTPDTLTTQEVVRLARIAIEHLGITKIRFTGGEPLLRRDLEAIVASCAAITSPDGNHVDLSITTNGLGLAHRAASLAQAGLDRVNISLDTINPDHYQTITHRNRLDDVLKGIGEARTNGLFPIKINAVLLKGVNDGDLGQLLTFCIQNDLQLRIIEQMPIGPEGSWREQTFMSHAEILLALSRYATLTPIERRRPEDPATLYMVDHNPSSVVGVIASVSTPFCHNCDRTRLTVDGQVRSCLFSTVESDLRTPLRSGENDESIAQRWRKAMWFKPKEHGHDGDRFAIPSRTMSRIGG